MADIETDVLIVGTGPAGSATAALLASYGVANMVVNRYRWLANTPRAHITNQRAMEVLRDLVLDAAEEVGWRHVVVEDDLAAGQRLEERVDRRADREVQQRHVPRPEVGRRARQVARVFAQLRQHAPGFAVDLGGQPP